ncbi:MAG: hypothetical protein WAZ12_03905 [Candidatus Absconditicoccaceae bacterium]
MLFDLGEQKEVQKSKGENVFNTETMLPVSEIKNDTLILKDGGLRNILRIYGLNLDLRNFDEQQIVLEQYKRFLNGLSFPIQIIIRNTYLDLSNYLQYVRSNVAGIDNMVLQNQGHEYTSFLEDIDSKQGLIYIKEFYIVVPYYDGEQDASNINKSWRVKLLNVLNAKDSVEKIVEKYRYFLKGKNMLETRVNLIVDGLASMGIIAEKLTTSEIISLLFRFYNPLIHGAQAKVNEEII